MPAYVPEVHARLTWGGAIDAGTSRVAALIQTRNTCGQRAVHNVLAMSQNVGNAVARDNQLANLGTLHGLGPMNVDIDDQDVRQMLDANGGQDVAVITSLDQVRNVVGDLTFHANPGDFALYAVARGARPRAFAVLNTLAGGGDPSTWTIGSTTGGSGGGTTNTTTTTTSKPTGGVKIGHWIAVEFTVNANGELVVGYADSLANRTDRRPLFAALARAMMMMR